MPKVQEPVLVEGRVSAFNLSPKGQIEGWLLACTEGTVQVNLPKGSEASLSGASVGDAVAVHAVLEEESHAHPVYLLVPEAQRIQGRVARLNYARHGEVNGFVLDDGTFIHLKPEGARKHPVRVGEEVEVQGTRKLGPAAAVLEATTVTRRRPGNRKAREARADT